VAASVTREFRIFTGANTLAFATLGLLAMLRRRAGMQLLVPATILLGATLVVGASYVFGQDWLHAIVFGDYIGLAYFAYLGGVAAFFADVALNRARISTELLNGVLHMAGSGLHVVPC
jgi:uncharacterized membrane protein (GlpM family)